MPRVMHFEIGSDDPNRAIKFYQTVFNWKIEKWNGPIEYWTVMTGDDTSPGINGGLMKRQKSTESVMNYIAVTSVDEYLKKITDAGGKICQSKMAIPGVGYLAVCQDTEGNSFGLIEPDTSAK